MRARDSLHRFVFEQSNVRGELVHLDASWQAVLDRQTYPAAVRDVLGEAVAAAALLTATLKFDGTLTLQVQGDGPVRMLVVQCTSQRTFRGLARWTGRVEPGPLPSLFGKGHMAITIEPSQSGERYQGIVAMGGGTLSDALEAYFRQSEQLDTRLWLEADSAGAAGLLLQALPRVSEDADAWERVVHLGAILTRQELLQLPAEQLLYRLFHEEQVRLFDALPVSFRCTCSRRRIEDVLRQLGPDEVRGIVKEQGVVSVDCEFCNHHYEFDAVDVEGLFASLGPTPVAPGKH
jgi:molecular chaperone Hsp33